MLPLCPAYSTVHRTTLQTSGQEGNPAGHDKDRLRNTPAELKHLEVGDLPALDDAVRPAQVSVDDERESGEALRDAHPIAAAPAPAPAFAG